MSNKFSRHVADRGSCATCLGLQAKICKAAAEADWSAPFEPLLVRQSEHFVPSRRLIWREPDLNETVPVICSGWAASVVTLSDGRRQITSFVLPGELVSTAFVHGPQTHFVVEAITDVFYRSFKRSEIKSTMTRMLPLLESIGRICVNEKARADEMIVDLGRRSAEERIARLILKLFNRIVERRSDRDGGQEIEFPLRQHHIADATGLTPVHVSKVLSAFRRKGLIEITDRCLTILDPVEFRRVADMR